MWGTGEIVCFAYSSYQETILIVIELDVSTINILALFLFTGSITIVFDFCCFLCNHLNKVLDLLTLLFVIFSFYLCRVTVLMLDYL